MTTLHYKKSYLSDADSNIQRLLPPIGTLASPVGIKSIQNSLLYNTITWRVTFMLIYHTRTQKLMSHLNLKIAWLYGHFCRDSHV